MIRRRSMLRQLAFVGGIALLAGCKVVPKGRPEAPPPPPRPAEESATGLLPSDRDRHRVALLVPLSGANAPVGQAIANATTMALLDTNAQNLRITTYDTAGGAQNAAARALLDGNKLILGPLLSDDAARVAAAARPAGIPMISYSNDSRIASRDVFVLGQSPAQAVFRVVSFARSRGLGRFAALVPGGEYGERSSAALRDAAGQLGAAVTATESYDRGNTSILSAAQRLHQKGGFDAVLIAERGRLAVQAAPQLKPAGAPGPRLLGTELWSGEPAILAAPAMRGAWFAALSDARYNQFVVSYRARFGSTPPRVATLGYDSVLLTIRVARNWRPGAVFPTDKLYDRGGFVGIDGPFRFGRDGVAERAFEVREIGGGRFTVVSPAPSAFGD